MSIAPNDVMKVARVVLAVQLAVMIAWTPDVDMVDAALSFALTYATMVAALVALPRVKFATIVFGGIGAMGCMAIVRGGNEAELAMLAAQGAAIVAAILPVAAGWLRHQSVVAGPMDFKEAGRLTARQNRMREARRMAMWHRGRSSVEAPLPDRIDTPQLLGSDVLTLLPRPDA